MGYLQIAGSKRCIRMLTLFCTKAGIRTKAGKGVRPVLYKVFNSNLVLRTKAFRLAI